MAKPKIRKRKSEADADADAGGVVALHRGEIKKRRGEKEEDKWKVSTRESEEKLLPDQGFGSIFFLEFLMLSSLRQLTQVSVLGCCTAAYKRQEIEGASY